MRSTDGGTCYLPGLAYHLETTDIRLISPQAYHQLYRGYSLLDGDTFDLHLDKPVNDDNLERVIGVPIDRMS